MSGLFDPKSREEPKPKPKGKHYLIVEEVCEPEEPEAALSCEHPDDCPTSRVSFADSLGTEEAMWWWDYECDVGMAIQDTGLSEYFAHCDAPKERFRHPERLAPGKYEIEYWFEVHPGGPWGPEEYSSGLALVEGSADGEGRGGS